MNKDEKIVNLESEVKTLRNCLKRQAYNMKLRDNRIKELEGVQK